MLQSMVKKVSEKWAVGDDCRVSVTSGEQTTVIGRDTLGIWYGSIEIVGEIDGTYIYSQCEAFSGFDVAMQIMAMWPQGAK